MSRGKAASVTIVKRKERKRERKQFKTCLVNCPLTMYILYKRSEKSLLE